LAHPVILLIDNDDGAKGVFSAAKASAGQQISFASSEPFYHLFANLYLVKTPEINEDSKSRIEDFFDPELFKTEINGKTFDPNKKYGAADSYSKVVFAEQVIKPRADNIDFSGFAPLLDRIVAVLQDYAVQRTRAAGIPASKQRAQSAVSAESI
jgi:RNA-directed DNA polymerase